MERVKPTSEARQRILETADRLFYQGGFRAVGIDRIIAEAGVAKMSLYKHFSSKDELVLAILKNREKTAQEFFRSAMERHGKRMKDPLRAFFAALKDSIEAPDFRGCPFINAAVEMADASHPARELVKSHNREFGEFLRGIVEQAVGAKAATVAPAVGLLVKGAIVQAVIDGSSNSADVARDAALRLVDLAKNE